MIFEAAKIWSPSEDVKEIERLTDPVDLTHKTI
jgi:hypothetical protein